MKALEFWMLCIPLYSLFNYLTPAQAWKRGALIYNSQWRDTEAWKRHVMRVDNSGSYNGQWLFDAAILTTHTVNGKHISYRVSGESNYLNEQDLNDLTDMFYLDASKLDQAIDSLSSEFGDPPSALQIFIGFPYLHPANTNLNIQGASYDLSNADRRVSATKWIVDNLLEKLNTREWAYFNFGINYHREDILINYDDQTYVKRLNDYVHERGMKSLWVPNHDATGWAFNGTGLGFDHTVIRPRYSVLSSVDARNMKGDQLYSTGYKAAGIGQCMAYEARPQVQGESEVEHYMAHQYLAISQLTGASQNEQVFSSGLPDIFDKAINQTSSPGKMWDTYTDLANYLGGFGIRNMEVGLNHNAFRDVNANLRELTYIVRGEYLQNLNSIRMDFNDDGEKSYWRGGLSVLVRGCTIL